jgi:hypothetical protein
MITGVLTNHFLNKNIMGFITSTIEYLHGISDDDVQRFKGTVYYTDGLPVKSILEQVKDEHPDHDIIEGTFRLDGYRMRHLLNETL